MYVVIFQDADQRWHWAMHGADHRRLAGSGPGFADQQACLLAVDEARRGLVDVAVIERIAAAPARGFVPCADRRGR